MKNVPRANNKEGLGTSSPPLSYGIIEIDGLCSMLSIGKNTAYNLLLSGEVDAFKVGSVWKIPLASVNDYIERKCKETKLVNLYRVINKNRDLYYEKTGQLPIVVN